MKEREVGPLHWQPSGGSWRLNAKIKGAGTVHALAVSEERVGGGGGGIGPGGHRDAAHLEVRLTECGEVLLVIPIDAVG